MEAIDVSCDDRFFSFEDFLMGSFEFSFSYLWFYKAYEST